MDCRALIANRIRQSGPVTVAEYMDLALYAPGHGYYARAVQRSGRAGDFVTSVDTGPLFGELLAIRFAAMTRALGPQINEGATHEPALASDLVEVAAGNGRLSRDILDAARRRDPAYYARLRVTLVERSETARGACGATLSAHAQRVHQTLADLPTGIMGIVFANELLDAMPVHVVVMTASGLAEVYVDERDGRFVQRLGPPSVDALPRYFTNLGLVLEPGARADVNLAAMDWIRRASTCLTRGYLVLIDYGHDALTLFSSAHATGTLRSFHRHQADATGADEPGTPPWLVAPGSRDLTTHVDFTSVRAEAERSGLVTLVDTDQSRFLLAAAEQSDLLTELSAPDRLRDRLALKTLLVPGGMGTTHRVVVFGKAV
jgi:SAM-dependent MidA family methyltransferase